MFKESVTYFQERVTFKECLQAFSIERFEYKGTYIKKRKKKKTG